MITMTRLEAELTQRLSAVTEERDHYKRELGMMRDHEAGAMLRVRFDLSDMEAALCVFLLSRPTGVVIHRDHILMAVWNGREAADNSVKIYVHKLRSKLGADTIKTVWGVGYFLTPEGRARLEVSS